MRDPAQIDRVLAAVREVWVAHPDSRLGQLLVNAVRASDPDSDLFSIEDTVLIRKLAALAKRLRQHDPALTIEWTGDLDDDCTAKWCGLLLRAEWMDGRHWWWAVSDATSGQEIDSSNSDGYFASEFTSGSAARQAAEKVARAHRQRRAN